MRQKYLAFLCSLAAWTLSAQGQVTPPLNDHYTNRIVLTGTDISFSGTLAGATRESNPFEVSPNFANGNQTVWWSWTALQSGTVTVQIFDPAQPANRPDGLAVWKLENIYTGQLVSGCHIDSRFSNVGFTFNAAAGTNYDIQLIGTDSAGFSFRLVQTNVPVIVESPKSQTITVGDSALFKVFAAGAGPFGYQWNFNGTNMPGETAPILQLDNVTADQAGAYSVVLTNSSGATASDTALLAVTPTDIPPLLSAQNVPNSNGFGFSLGVLGEVGRRYRIQSSTNLFDWTPQTGFPTPFVNWMNQPAAISVVMAVSGTNYFSLQATGIHKLFRATPFHATNEVCNNHMKTIRAAQMLFSYERRLSALDSVEFGSLRPYFKNQLIPLCPAGGTYLITTTLRNPVCTLHAFEEP